MAAPFALIFGEGLSEARFLCPSGTRNARFFVLRHRAWGTGGKRQPGGLLRKATRRREQIQGLCAASTQNADICEGSETMSAPEGSVSPVGCWAEGPKRPEGVSKYKGCARPAHRTPIFAKGREARMIEQPGRKKRGSFQNQGFFNGLCLRLKAQAPRPA